MRRWRPESRAGKVVKRILVVLTVPVFGLGQGLVPVTAAVGGAAAITAVSTAVSKAPAHALSGTALILSTSVNGGSSSVEAQQATALGLTVTVASAATWDATSTATFKTYSAIIIGDPSTSTTCSNAAPTDAVSTASTWGAAVTGNVAVLGTAPALGNATTLISDAIAYAASGSGTGLYVSLNCEDSTMAAGTNVPLLASVDGGGFTVTGRGSGCPGNAGSVNAFRALALSPFNGLSSANLGPWSSPACSVQESFDTWPGALGGLGYLAGASPAQFTASDGTTGQAYILAGATPSAATTALSSATGGQVPALTAVGGRNPAAPGVSADVAGDPVDTENGDFTESDTDLSIPTFGPSLDFSRDYDAELAQRQSVAATPVAPGAPGSLGYGWTDNWDTSLSTGGTVPGDIYTIDGLQTGTGRGGPATSAALNLPDAVAQNGGNIYIADTNGNRIEEIPGSSGTQWGISMTAGDIYTVVGSDTGTSGVSCSNGTAMASCLLNAPQGVSADSSGDLFVADTDNNRVLEIPSASGTNYGISMTADDAYTVAGHASGAPGHGGDGGAANVSFMSSPSQVLLGVGGDSSLYIADSFNNRIQEVFETGGEQWGQSMTANDIYSVAGSAAGSVGLSGDAGAATSALFDFPQGITLSSAGDLYIADTDNCQVREVPKTSGTQWGASMTANDVYRIAGKATGLCGGPSPDGTAGGSTALAPPSGVVANNGQQLYITDTTNNRIAELARTSHTEWGISMTADELYNIAGQASGASGFTGNGGLATSADMNEPSGPVAFSASGMYIADNVNDEVRFVSSTSSDISDFAGGVGAFAQDGDGGPSVDAGLDQPAAVTSDSHGDVFVADTIGNRVQEIAAYSHTQFGVAMTAGDVYTVAGSSGISGLAGDGGPATSAFLFLPAAVAVDSAGNLYIADSVNDRVQKVSASTGNISTFAGSATGVSGNSGQGGVATAARLDSPYAVATDTAGDVFIAGLDTNQAYEVPAASGTQFGITMTAGHIYTIAGSTAGTLGSSGDGGPATSSLLEAPQGIATDASGDVYISDTANNRIQEIARTTHTQWGLSMTAGDIYTVAGSSSAPSGSGDGGPAGSAGLDGPVQITVDSSGDLYIADSVDGTVREVASATGTQWAQAMTAGDIYSVAGTGSPSGPGDGGPATSINLVQPTGIGVDPFGDLFITNVDFNNLANSHLREVISGNGPLVATSPTVGATWSTSGITITQPGGSQITFYPKSGGSCVSPYVATGSGGYCALPQYTDTNLTFSSGGGGTYTYTPSPGLSYTYGSAGALQSETDSEGDSATATYGSPAPGSGNCPATATSCSTITSTSGRALVIGYNSSNLVTSATDPMGRRWTYTYSASDLTKATDPLGNITTYTYDTSNANATLANDMLTITGPNGQPGGPDAGDDTVNAYDSYGRVTSQTDPMGNATQFNYCVNAVAGDCMNTATGTGSTTVTDPVGNTTIDSYLAGSLTGTAGYSGGSAPTAAKTFVPNQSATGTSAGTQLDTATEDGNGNITTYAYNANGYATDTTQPDGVGSQSVAVTRTITALDGVSCSSSFADPSTCSLTSGPSPVAPGGVITPPSAPPAGATWVLYDTDGNELYVSTSVYEPGSSTAAYVQTSYQLFASNTITLGGTHISCAHTPPSASLPCAAINADGVVTQLTYDAQGDLTSSATPDGNGTETAVTSYAYDSDGEQTSQVSPDGNLTGANAANYTAVSVYNNDGRLTSVTQAGAPGATVTPRASSFGYDGDGNQTSVNDARGFTTTTAFNADDEATLVTDPDGNATLKCYDGDGNAAQTVPPAGVASGGLTASSCPTSYPAGYTNRLASDSTVTTYDAMGDQIQQTTPAPAGHSGSETTTSTYDTNGNLVETLSPSSSNGGASLETVDTYNSSDELASETVGYGTTSAATTSYCYDPDGHVTSVVMPDGNTSGLAQCENSSPWIVNAASYPTQAAYQTTSAYDSSGELASTTSPATSAAPSGATTALTYDAVGNTLTSLSPDGITTTWTYTPLDKISTIAYSGSSAHSVSFVYDANGNKTSMTDGSGSSSFAFDPFNELTSATNGTSSTAGYTYDLDGNTSAITYPLPSSASWATSDTVSETYDHADLLSSVTDFNNHALSIGYTADGTPNSVGLGATGDTITTSYDNSGSPSAIALKNASATLQSFTYSDAPSGDVLTETDTPSSANSPAVYTYDSAGRATSMTPGTNSALSYGFDSSSNLTTLPNGAAGTYDHDGELTSSAKSGSTTSYSYDANGQRLTVAQGSTTLATGTWNGAGQLASYSNSSANMSSAGYDGNGMRVSSTTTPSGGSAVTQDYLWDTSSTARLLMDSSNAYIYGDYGVPIEQVNLATGSVTYLVTDLLNSVRGTANSSGSLTGTTSYDAWGNPETSGGLTASTPFGYAGGYTDGTGLLYLINRYYDPATGQFTSVDPDVSNTLQPYEYAGGDPVVDSDPTGLDRTQAEIKQWHKVSAAFNICIGYNGTGVCGTYHNVTYENDLLGQAIERNFSSKMLAVTDVAAAFYTEWSWCHPSFRFVFKTNGKIKLRAYVWGASKCYTKQAEHLFSAVGDQLTPGCRCDWPHGGPPFAYDTVMDVYMYAVDAQTGKRKKVGPGPAGVVLTKKGSGLENEGPL
jgi:RHS repeat-associated protein